MSTSERDSREPQRLDIQIIEVAGADPGWWRLWSEPGRVLVDLALAAEGTGRLRWALLVDGMLAGCGAEFTPEAVLGAARAALRHHLARTLRGAPLAWELRWACGDGTTYAGQAHCPGAAIDAALRTTGWGVPQQLPTL